MSKSELLKAQTKARRVLEILDGWVCSEHLRLYGVWPVSVQALVANGEVWHRETEGPNGQLFQEWRLIKTA